MENPFRSLSNDQLDLIAQQGWVIDTTLFDRDFCLNLYREAQNLRKHFKTASISKEHVLLTDYRNDETLWISESSPIQKLYLDQMEHLKNQLNSSFYLGLRSYESHFAIYPPGHFYKTHIDNFKNFGPRRITTVLFLNDQWTEQDGGQLIIYPPEPLPESKAGNQTLAQILPQSTTLVIFRSEIFPHEVLAPSKERCSIAGWFRID